MNTVWKYEISADDYLTLDLPLGARPLTVREQNGKPHLWCLVDDAQSIYECRKFRLAGTGHPIKENNLEFLGTFQIGSFVGHLFEIFPQ